VIDRDRLIHTFGAQRAALQDQPCTFDNLLQRLGWL